MTQSPAILRSTSLPSVCAALPVVLALGLLSFVLWKPAEVSPSPSSISGEKLGAPANPHSEEPARLAFCRPPLSPSGEALRQSCPTVPGLDARQAAPGFLLVHQVDPSGLKLTAWRGPFRGRLPSAPYPPRHVLFCTWLTRAAGSGPPLAVLS